jgi:hypothetical protein
LYGFFPDPFEDELLYSVLARMWVMLGETSSQHLFRAAFGYTSRSRVDATIPTNLTLFANRLAYGISGGCDALIDRHTALPYLSRFMEPNTYWHVRDRMKGHDASASLTRRLLQDNSRLWQGSLAFCPSCVVADIGDYGMPGFRRVHQMPGVFVCPRHETALRSTLGSKMANYDLIACPLEPDGGYEIHNPLDPTVSTWLSKGAHWLLANQEFLPRIDRIRMAMGSLLARRSWIGSNWKSTPDLKAEFYKRFRWKGLEVIDPKYETGRGVVETVLESKKASRSVPVCFLILLMMLEVTPEDFFQTC